MDIRQWPIFKAGLFRQGKYLFSAPQKAQKVMAITETGAVSIEPLNMNTGFIRQPESKRAWAAVHALKYQIYKNGQPTQNEAVLVISERNYIPLDPLNTLNQEDREKLASLKDIAKVRHAQARAQAARVDNSKDIASLIVNWSFIFMLLLAAVAFVRGC